MKDQDIEQVVLTSPVSAVDQVANRGALLPAPRCRSPGPWSCRSRPHHREHFVGVTAIAEVGIDHRQGAGNPASVRIALGEGLGRRAVAALHAWIDRRIVGAGDGDGHVGLIVNGGPAVAFGARAPCRSASRSLAIVEVVERSKTGEKSRN